MLRKLVGALGKARADAPAQAVSSPPRSNTATLRDGHSKPASELVRGDLVVVEAGEVIPADGRVVEGLALVDESAITGESDPVVRESDTDRSAVIGGTRALSNRIVVEVTTVRSART